VEATPKISVRAGNSVAPLERRLRVRQRVDAIVYLDIGADNGGIVLNLSEEGLRFQAVGPLDKQTELSLRIKLPGSRTRIDVTARIAWLSDSKRQAGVRFLDVQSGGPVRIQEWIRSQASHGAPREESSKQVEEVAESQRKQETIRELPTDKNLSPMPESEFSELSPQKPPEIESDGMRHRVPAARKDPVSYQKPEFVSPPIAEPAESPSVGRPATENESLQAAAVQAVREAAVISEKPEVVSEPFAEPAQLPTVERPAQLEESLQAAAPPTARKAAVISEKPEVVSEPFVEPAQLPTVERPAQLEESLQAAAPPTAREAAVISEKPEVVSEPYAEPARLPTVERPALQEESLQAAAPPTAREAAVISEKPEVVSEQYAEPAKSPAVGRPALQEESLQAAAVPTAREAAVISEKPEVVSELFAEPAQLPTVERPALQEESLQAAAVSTARKAAVISEKPEVVSEPFVEPAQLPTVERPPLQEESLQAAAVSTAREAAVISEMPELVSEPYAEPAKSPSLERPTTQEESSQTAAFQTPGANARSEPEGGDATIAAPSHDESRGESTLGWPTSISRTVAMAIPRPPDAPFKPVERFASAGKSNTNSTPAVANTVLAVPPTTDRMLLWNQIAIAVFLMLCAVLCFGIGTWVGQIVSRRNSSSAAVAPVNVAPTAEPGANVSTGNAGSNAGRLAPATAEKVRTGPSSAHSEIENRKVVTSTSSPDVIPLPQSAPSNPPEQNVAAVATTKEQESSPPAAPAQVDSPAPAPSPRVVAGLTLKPSDRFNPCYLSYRVEPAYPPEAQKQQIEGVVKIQQVVGTDGRVRSVKLLSGPPLLVTAALEAARYWRYLPALLNGQPVETEQDVEINFRLPY
jgi:TonB family protein